MAIDLINVGTANQGDGDPLRDAFVKANNMFTELYNDDAGDVGSIIAGTGVAVDQATGDVTVSLADDGVSYAKMGSEFTTSATISASDVDFSSAAVFTKTLSANTTLTFSNAQIGMVKDLVITGNHALTLPAGSTVAGTYDGTVSNLIQVVVTGAGQYWYSISQPQ